MTGVAPKDKASGGKGGRELARKRREEGKWGAGVLGRGLLTGGGSWCQSQTGWHRAGSGRWGQRETHQPWRRRASSPAAPH